MVSLVKAGQPPLPDLRQKPSLDPRCTDRELFEAMALSDCWHDAELPALFNYLLAN